MCWFLYLLPSWTDSTIKKCFKEIPWSCLRCPCILQYSCSLFELGSRMCALCAIQKRVEHGHGTLFYEAKLLPGRSSAHLCDCGGCGRFRVISVSKLSFDPVEKEEKDGQNDDDFSIFVQWFYHVQSRIGMDKTGEARWVLAIFSMFFSRPNSMPKADLSEAAKAWPGGAQGTGHSTVHAAAVVLPCAVCRRPEALTSSLVAFVDLRGEIHDPAISPELFPEMCPERFPELTWPCPCDLESPLRRCLWEQRWFQPALSSRFNAMDWGCRETPAPSASWRSSQCSKW